MGVMLEELLSNILGIAEVLVFAWGICQVELTMDWRRWAVACGLWIVEMAVVLSGFWDEMAVVPVTILGNMAITSFLMVSDKILYRVIKYWFCFFYVGIAFRPIYFVITFLNEYAVKLSWIDFGTKNLASGCNICVIVLAAIQIRKRKQWVSWVRSMSLKYYMIGLFCCFCANGLKNYMGWEIAGLDMKNKLFWGILTNILYYRESSLKSEYLRMAQEHYNNLAEHMFEVRSIRHDMMAHMNAMEYLIQEGKTGEVITYLHEMKENMGRKNNKKIDVGIELVNAVMENELKKADLDTHFSVEGYLADQPAISDFDMCVIFSNLLSNAVEACKRISGMENKAIQLEIKQINGNLLIEMKNPIYEQIALERLGAYTSKKDSVSHGYGIYNIRKTIEKYGGDIEFRIEDDIFSARICFYEEM